MKISGQGTPFHDGCGCVVIIVLLAVPTLLALLGYMVGRVV